MTKQFLQQTLHRFCIALSVVLMAAPSGAVQAQAAVDTTASQPAALQPREQLRLQRTQERAHIRLVQQQIELEPDYAGVKMAYVGTTLLFIGCAGAGVTALGFALSGMLRGFGYEGTSGHPRTDNSGPDRERDYLIAGVAGGVAVAALIGAILMRRDARAQYDALKVRVEQRLSVTSFAPYATPTGAGLALGGEF